ncbi:MAG: 16S rRNA (guanine(527)-N(7))-methyltransferase RsmG [Dictyoglomaceae bacterium]|nr:16S rRNA (guanine(527)-N(7))-methyltransferase RsmG [Dictyoglomaceae bacterium]
MKREEFSKFFLEKLKILEIYPLSSQEELFYKYLENLMIWNRKINLTSIEKEEEIILKHFIDSLTCSLALKEEIIEKVIDVGTGAGFPGIPLKIIFPSWKLTLLESQKKKIEFLKELINNLELQDVEIIWDRAENLAKKENYREKYDLVLARGVAKPNVVLEYTIPFLKLNGIFLAQTGEKNFPEWEKVVKISEILGAKWDKVIKFKLDDWNRVIIIFRKIKNTPENYPRKPGIPEKRPLEPKDMI